MKSTTPPETDLNIQTTENSDLAASHAEVRHQLHQELQSLANTVDDPYAKHKEKSKKIIPKSVKWLRKIKTQSPSYA